MENSRVHQCHIFKKIVIVILVKYVLQVILASQSAGFFQLLSPTGLGWALNKF